MPPKGRGRGGSSKAGRGGARGARKTVADVIPESERPSAEALEQARAVVLGGNYGQQRSKEGCYNVWCHKNGIDPSGSHATREDKLQEIVYYTAYMSQNKECANKLQ